MDLERLKKLLESGMITQEEFDSLVAGLQLEETEETTEEEAEEGDTKTDSTKDKQSELDNLVSAAVKKAVDKLGSENKTLREQLKEEQKKNLTAEELKKFELEEKERELEEKKNALLLESNRMYALKALKKAKLDDGSEDTLDLLELVIAENEESIDTKVIALEKYVSVLVSKKVDAIFKQNGREPGKGRENGTVKNPYKTGNFTEQTKLEIENPTLAAKLKASATQ